MVQNAGITEVFNGQSDIILFDSPTGGYSDSLTFAGLTAQGISLGQIVEDSTSWEGEDPTLDGIRDEQGDMIVVQPTAGTYAFSCDLANISSDNMALFMKAAKVTPTATTGSSFKNFKNLVKVVDLPVITRPIAIVNDEANKFIIFPKAKIVGSMNLDSKLWRIHITATAEYIETAELGTFMMGDADSVEYGAAED